MFAVLGHGAATVWRDPRHWFAAASVATASAATVLWLERRVARARAAGRAAKCLSDRLYRILDCFPAGIQIAAQDMTPVWMNQDYADRKHPAIARTAGEIAGDSDAAARAHDRSVLDSRRADGPREQIVRGPDGAIHSISSVTKFPLFENGEIAHIVTVDVDVTARRRRSRTC